SQNYPGAMEQAKNPRELEAVEDAKEAPPLSHSYVWTYKMKGQQESLCERRDELFYRPEHEENPEEAPTPTPSKPEQGLNPAGQLFYNLLVSSNHPAETRTLENKPKDKTSPPGGRSLGPRPADEPRWKRPKEEGAPFPSKASGARGPAAASPRGDLFETKLRQRLRALVPDEAVRAFVGRAARALRADCGLPAAQPACAKMVSKLGLLMEVLSEQRDGRGASALAGRCFPQGDVPNGTARLQAAGGKLAGKKKSAFAHGNGLLIAVSVSLSIILFLMLICLIEVCSQKSAAAYQPQGTGKSRLRRFFQKFLPERRSKKGPDAAKQVRASGTGTAGARRPPRRPPAAPQGSPGSDPSGNKPPWLRDVYQPLDSQRKRSLAQKLLDEESSDEEEIFNKAEMK
ncbi:L37A2 protein, partial [Nothoprocta ornata]|nr:L37A2 protein [Nothoprocta ornata]